MRRFSWNTETWLTTVSMTLTESLPVHSCCSLCLMKRKHLMFVYISFFPLFCLSCSWAAQKPRKRCTTRPKWPLDATKGRCSSSWTLCRVEVLEGGSGNPLNWDTSTLKCGFRAKFLKWNIIVRKLFHSGGSATRKKRRLIWITGEQLLLLHSVSKALTLAPRASLNINSWDLAC